MQTLLTLVCVSSVLNTVYTAVSIQPSVPKPAAFACQDGCYNPDLNIVLPYNVTYSPQDGQSCKGYLCQYNGETQIFTCGALGVGPGCRLIPGDLTKPYPNCCDTATCDPSASAKATATATA